MSGPERRPADGLAERGLTLLTAPASLRLCAALIAIAMLWLAVWLTTR